jgi:S-adenosylmethionine:tRNA ribosyltransferase-isomerase
MPGAVAAPTAGLHLTEALLEQLGTREVATAFVTLHVGVGTFAPVRTERVADHPMHAERYQVSPATARAAGRRVAAVGTTALRAIESAARDGVVYPAEAETRLFIRPGYRFQVVDRLITNFHLPRSTLLMLVCAFAGLEPVQRAYRHANRWRRGICGKSARRSCWAIPFTCGCAPACRSSIRTRGCTASWAGADRS